MNTEKIIKRFNSKAEEWLTELKAADENTFHVNPNEKLWSIAEVYDHVMRVGRKYQIPNLKKSVTDEAKRKKRKNMAGMAVFNLGFRKNIHMRMESFPAPLVEDFTPVKRSKLELITDFESFIKEVNALKDILNSSTKEHKHYHPMFGDISTKEWFALIELHIWQHDKQKKKIRQSLSEMK